MLTTLLAQSANFGKGGTEGLLPPASAYNLGPLATDKTGAQAASNLELIISQMIGLATILAGLMFLVYFIVAALNWISSGGESAKVIKAREQITQGVIGLIVLISAYIMIGLVGSILGLKLLNPGQAILDLNPIK